ncbi:MAG: peptidylprolyl isomerase [Muribaculaceae bacterium]|nr:peptidylprolyl isomerase [Muribaculaceae bacterium]
MKRRKMVISATVLTALCALAAPVKRNVVDEVAWIVGDEPIYRSEIEEMYTQMRSEGQNIPGDPYCVIPERMAVEKLYLHQAKLDTIEANEGWVQSNVEQRLQYFVNNLGSKEKVEEYFHKPYGQLRESLVDMIRNNSIVENVKGNITKDIKATPNDVRKYFSSLPEDSIPYVPMQVEAQIVSIKPIIPAQEIEDVKARLRDYADRVNRGEAKFSTLAIAYSEDPGSSMQGGEMGYMPRAAFVPEFANVAFNLNDPNKVSRIVETEFGYHIIQLIDKRGDQVNVRHILLTPKVSTKDLTEATVRLDSLRKEIVAGKYTFEDAARYVSQDKATKNNKGIMMNENTLSSRFEMGELPAEVARRIELLKPGEVSEAFIMKDQKSNKDIVAMVKLTNRIPGHKANLSEDYNMIKKMYEAKHENDVLREWVEKKIKDTYVKISDDWKNCEFEYDGWIK